MVRMAARRRLSRLRRDVLAGKRDMRRERSLGSSEQLAGEDKTPSEALSKLEELAKVEAVLKVLSPQERLIISRRLRDGKPWAEIARELGKRKEAVEMAFLRSLRKVRRALGQGKQAGQKKS